MDHRLTKARCKRRRVASACGGARCLGGGWQDLRARAERRSKIPHRRAPQDDGRSRAGHRLQYELWHSAVRCGQGPPKQPGWSPAEASQAEDDARFMGCTTPAAVRRVRAGCTGAQARATFHEFGTNGPFRTAALRSILHTGQSLPVQKGLWAIASFRLIFALSISPMWG
jgi:hypothetical protein